MNSRFYIHICLLAITSVFAKNPESIQLPIKPFVVVLDAGHGGHDSGNRGGGYFEKNIALDIILKTGKILEKADNIKVVYTRKTDVFIPLSKRADIANKEKADLFVSVHCNAHHSNAFGTETFVLGLHANQSNFNIAKKENAVILLEDDYKTNYDGFDPNSPESVIGLTLMQEEYLEQSLSLASYIQYNFTKQLKRSNRGVKQAGFLVLHRTFMPSVLVETGFLTNRNEGKYLNSSKGKQNMALAISKAVIDYKKSISSSFITSTPIALPEEKKDVIPEKNNNLKKVAPTKVKTEQILFKVQIAVGSKSIETVSKNFKGLEKVSRVQYGEIYKYYYGETSSYNEIVKHKELALQKGFSESFIVGFKNNSKIPLIEAIKLSK